MFYIAWNQQMNESELQTTHNSTSTTQN